MSFSEEVIMLLRAGRIDEAIAQSDSECEPNTPEDERLYRQGNLYYKSGNWQQAINHYLEALALNPNSPAAESLKMANNILSFYNKDVYGQ